MSIRVGIPELGNNVFTYIQPNQLSKYLKSKKAVAEYCCREHGPEQYELIMEGKEPVVKMPKRPEPEKDKDGPPLFVLGCRVERHVIAWRNQVRDAARAKLMLQVMMGNIVGSLAEMMALSKAAGLDEAAILEVLGESAMANPLCKAKGELMRKNDYKPNFQVYLQQKDLRLALQLADDLGVPAPISAASNGQYIRARQMGFADKDFAAVRAAYEAEVLNQPETEDA